MTILRLDYETKSEVDIKKVGLDVYSAHPTTRILMAAYQFDNGSVSHWDHNDGRMPAELREALEDPSVQKRAFNAQFERVMTKRVAKIKTPVSSWRCTMATAYLQSFVGGLGDIGYQMGLPLEHLKDKNGMRLIRMFSMPQKITKNQPHVWRDCLTDPDDWEMFCQYNIQDVIAEAEIDIRLSKFDIPESEWHLYHLDQLINDRGLPIDTRFASNADDMAIRRKAELADRLRVITGLSNPNSTQQILPWLHERGYPFDDLRKDTVSKVLREAEDTLDATAVTALKVRQDASRTSVAKYTAIKSAVGPNDRFRFAFQFAGATRTARWAGRRVQVQNLPRTPKSIEPDGKDISKLAFTTELIRRNDYDGLGLMIGEHMNALVGCIRSAIRAPDGYELRVCDLASIETCVIAWLAGCVRLLSVIRGGKDAYKDFATVLYAKDYEDVTKGERSNAKPAVLGSGYRLGGGDLRDGKRTGLWGYAENMGIEMDRDTAHKATQLFRETYHEIPQLWYDLERVVSRVLKTGVVQTCGPLTFRYERPYMTVELPSGRKMYYFKPKIISVVPPWGGEPRKNFSYMGQQQGTGKWVRLTSHGGKLVENFVQAIARDILREGLFAAHKAGFYIVGHVHDEIITMQPISDTVHTVEALGEYMTRKLHWCPDLPLGAAGWAGPFYMKD